MEVSEIVTLLLVHLSFVSCAVILVVIAKKKAKTPLQLAFGALAVILSIWNVGTMLDLDYRLLTGATVESTLSILLIDVCYFSICFSPVVMLTVGRILTKPGWKLRMWHALYLVIPVISFMMVCTNPLHHLFFQHFSLDSNEAVYGPYFYFHSLYSYTCIAIGLTQVVRFSLRASGILSKQFLLIAIGLFIPLVGNVMFSFGMANLTFSITACLFTASIICFYIAIDRYGFITPAPIDRRQVVDLVSEGFLQTDDNTRIVDYNKTLINLFPDTPAIANSTTVADFFSQPIFIGRGEEYMQLYRDTIVNQSSVNLEVGLQDAQYCTMRITPFYDRGKYTGSIVIFKGVGDTKPADNSGLQTALDEVERSNRYLSEKVEEGMAQLEQEKQAARALYDSNPYINFIASTEYQVIDCNPSAMSFYGFESKEEFKVGLMQKLNAAILPTMPGGIRSIPVNERFDEVAKLGETSFDTILNFDGEEIPFHFDVRLVPHRGEKVIAVYQTDLRKLRKAEQDLERRDKLLSAVNTVAAQLFSVDEGEFGESLWKSLEMLGRSVGVQRVTIWQNHEENGELFHTQIHEWSDGVEMTLGKQHTTNISNAQTVPTWAGVLRSGKCVNALAKDMLPVERAQMGRQGIVSVLAVPIFIRDAFWGSVGFDDCVNERVFTELEETTLSSGAMLIASAFLRNEITQTLITTRESALSSARAKSAFLANMSHEIRTPLNAIVGMAHIARQRADDAKVTRSIDEILSASKHLMELINDILDFSKIESGKLELTYETFDLSAAMHEVVSLISPRCAEKSIALETNVGNLPKMAVSGDKLRLKQVLINLLGNAVKFTDRSGAIAFTIDLEERQPDQATLRFAIRDNGIGISAEQIPNLFTAFEQGDSHIAIKYEGTGLGLAISQNIVKAMGGEILVESVHHEGSTFSFTITLQKKALPVHAEHRGSYAENAALAGKRILVAEDIEINRIILTELLADTGVTLDEAVDGVQALECFAQSPLNHYDLIFMDVQMPNMDGYQATESIRGLDREDAATVPIIAMTANAYREDVERAMAAGMNGHLAKPIDIDAVKELLYARLNGSGEDAVF